MDGALHLDFPQGDVDKLFRTMNRAVKELGMSIPSSLAWTGALLSRSLSASTRIAPKLRKIVRNPDKRYLTDRRRAPFGVMVYKKGQHVFKPIFRTGEYGKIRFYDKKSSSWFERFGPNRNTWQKVASGPDIANPEIIVPGIKTDKRRNIGRRGLAKKNWRTIARFIRRNGRVKTLDVAGAGDIRWSGDRNSLTITNELRYAQDALKGDATTAASRAEASLAHQIDKRVRKKFGMK